jgi:hypothetical protein
LDILAEDIRFLGKIEGAMTEKTAFQIKTIVEWMRNLTETPNEKYALTEDMDFKHGGKTVETCDHCFGEPMEKLRCCSRCKIAMYCSVETSVKRGTPATRRNVLTLLRGHESIRSRWI